MEIKCKNCGKEFILSKGEMDFYKSKNLHLPKRCKVCRQANRANKSVSTISNQPKQSSIRSIPNHNDNLSILIKILSVVLIVVIAIFAIPSIFNNESETSNDIHESVKILSFRNTDYLLEHFEKHGGNMGYTSSSSYLQGANNVIVAEEVMTRIQSDSDTAYFLQSSGEFVVVSYDGYIRTYFIPEDGIEYFNRQ